MAYSEMRLEGLVLENNLEKTSFGDGLSLLRMSAVKKNVS